MHQYVNVYVVKPEDCDADEKVGDQILYVGADAEDEEMMSTFGRFAFDALVGT